jgi:hypothetical protein
MLAAALSRRSWIAGLVTLALAGAASGVALAAPTAPPHLIVHITVPREVLAGRSHDIVVHGDARVSSSGVAHAVLDVYTSLGLNAPQVDCPATAKEAAAQGDHRALSKLVLGPFSLRVEFREPGQIITRGYWEACAYLVFGHTSGRAQARWTIR